MDKITQVAQPYIDKMNKMIDEALKSNMKSLESMYKVKANGSGASLAADKSYYSTQTAVNKKEALAEIKKHLTEEYNAKKAALSGQANADAELKAFNTQLQSDFDELTNLVNSLQDKASGKGKTTTRDAVSVKMQENFEKQAEAFKKKLTKITNANDAIKLIDDVNKNSSDSKAAAKIGAQVGQALAKSVLTVVAPTKTVPGKKIDVAEQYMGEAGKSFKKAVAQIQKSMKKDKVALATVNDTQIKNWAKDIASDIAFDKPGTMSAAQMTRLQNKVAGELVQAVNNEDVYSPSRTIKSNGFNKFQAQLSESRKKYFTDEGLGKRLEVNIKGIKPGAGTGRVATSADRELASLFNWADKNGFVVMYEQTGSGDKEKYQFYVTPQELYNAKDLRASKAAGYTFDWIAPDEYGRLTTGNLGSTSQFFLDARSGKYLDLNTWGLAKNVSAIKNYGSKKKGDDGYKTIQEVNNLIKAQASSTRQAAPVDFYGNKDIESLEWDVSHANIDVASDEEKRRADALMTWAATLTSYFETHINARKEAAGWVGKQDFESWEVPQAIQNVLHRYLMERTYNAQNYMESIQNGDDELLKKFARSTNFAKLIGVIDQYFAEGGGYYIHSLSHGSTSVGKALANIEADLPFTDMLAMQSTASENTSKGKANSINRKIASYEDLLEHGWAVSSLRENGGKNTSSLVTKSIALPEEILQAAVNKQWDGARYIEGVSEERLFGDSEFAKSAKFYSNSKKNFVETSALNNNFKNYFASLGEEIADINDLALNQTLHLNQNLDKKTNKQIKLSDKLSIPKGSYVTSVTRTENGYEISYLTESALRQGQKFVDTGTNQRHEFGYLKQENVLSAIDEADDSILDASQKKLLKDAISKGDIHTFMLDTSDKRSSSMRVQGTFNEGYWEYLVNQIQDGKVQGKTGEELFNIIANKHKAFGGRYRWDSTANGGKGGVKSNLTDRGGVTTTLSGKNYYADNSFWTDIDEQLKKLIRATNEGITEKEVLAKLPQYRAAYGANIKTTQFNAGNEMATLDSLYDDVYKTMVDMELVEDGLQRRVKYIAPNATSVAEYSGMAGLGYLDNGESQMRVSTRLKENIRGRLEKLVMANKITQEDMDKYLQEYDKGYSGDARSINKYNSTLSAVRNEKIAGKTLFSAVLGTGKGTLQSGEALHKLDIDISQADFNAPSNQEITDDEYKKSVIGFLYNQVKQAGFTLGEDAQVQLSFAGLNDETKAALKAVGFYDGQILAITPEEVAKINTEGISTRQVGANDRENLTYLRNFKNIVAGEALEDSFKKKITNASGNLRANAGYQKTLKAKVVSGGEIYKEAAGSKALASANMKVVASNDLMGDFGIISKQGALNLLKLGNKPAEEDINVAFASIIADIETRGISNKSDDVKSLIDNNIAEEFNNAKLKNKKKLYNQLLKSYVNALEQNEMELPTFVLRNPLINEANVISGLKINNDVAQSKQGTNILMLPKLAYELLNADFDGDMIQVCYSLISENAEIGQKLFQQIKDAGIQTRQELINMGEWSANDSLSPEEYAKALIEESRALSDSEIRYKFTASTHEGQQDLGKASHANTSTQANLRAARAIAGDEDGLQYIQDEIYRTYASEIVEQNGISAKKTLEAILGNKWTPESLNQLSEAMFHYEGTDEQNKMLKDYGIKSKNPKLQYIIQSLRETFGDEKLEQTGIFKARASKNDAFELNDDALIRMAAHASRVNKEAEGKSDDKWLRSRYDAEKLRAFQQINPDLVGTPGGKTGNYFEDYNAEKGAVDNLSGEYDEHTKSVDAAAQAEKDKLGISALLAKELGIESNKVDELAKSYTDLTKAEEESVEASKEQAELGTFITAEGPITEDKNYNDNHTRYFTAGGKEFGVGQSDSVTELIQIKEEPDPELNPNSPQAIALKNSAFEGTYAHKLVELMGKYQTETVEALFTEAVDSPELATELEKAEKELRNKMGLAVTEDLLETLKSEANTAFSTGKQIGLINENTKFEQTFAGRFANSNRGLSGQSDIVDDEHFTIGDWKFSNVHTPAAKAKHILQASVYMALYEEQMATEISNLKTQLEATDDETVKAQLETSIKALESKLSGYEQYGKVKVLITSLDKDNQAFTEIIESDRLDKIEVLKFINSSQEYKSLFLKKTELQKLLSTNKSEKTAKELADVDKQIEEILDRGLGMASASKAAKNATSTFVDSTGQVVNTGGQGADYFKKRGGNSTNKDINAYLRNYKAQQKVEEELQKKQNAMQGKSGTAYDNIQKEIDALRNKQAILKEQALLLTEEEDEQGKIHTYLNGQELTEEQIKKIKEQISLADADHLVKQRLITTQAKEQQGFLQKLVSGFKNQITMFIDTSLAYQAIGKVRSSVRELIQLTEQLDEQLVNIQIATGYSRSEVHALLQDYNDLASQLGRTTSDVASAANDWLRAGYEGEEAAELTQASMMLSTLGMIESADATTYLISTLKGWQLEANEVIRVVDKLTAVDMSAAISAGDLALAMSRANNSARLAGVDMDNFIGYVTTVADVSQKSAESVGESFKTIFSRFGNVKAGKYVATDLDTTSEDYDEAEYENLNDIETVLSKVNIKVRENATTWRDVDDVLTDIGEKWATWDQTTQNAVATAVAGTRQRENVITLFENWDDVAKYAEIAEDAYGTATEKMEAYTDSVEASKQRLTNAIEEWALWFNGSDAIKLVYDTLTNITENLHIFGAALAGFTVITNFNTVVEGFTTGLGKIGTKLFDFNQLLSVDEVSKGSFKQGLQGAKTELITHANMLQEQEYAKSLERYISQLDQDTLIKAKSVQQGLLELPTNDKKLAATMLSLAATNTATAATNSEIQSKYQEMTEEARVTLAQNLLAGVIDKENEVILQQIISKKGVIAADEDEATVANEYKAVMKELIAQTGNNAAAMKRISSNLNSSAITQGSALGQAGAGLGSIAGMMVGGSIGRTLTSELSGTMQSLGTIIGATIAQKALSGIGQGIGTLIGGGTASLASFGGWGMLAAAVITALGAVFAIAKKREQEAIEEAQENFKEAEEKLTAAKGTKQLAARYDELSAGVNELGQNVALTDEEYQEFLETSNSLAEAFPELIVYTDEAGNKIIKMGDAFSTTADKVDELYDSLERDADLALINPDNMGKALDDVKTEIAGYEDQKTALEDDLNEADVITPYKFANTEVQDYYQSEGLNAGYNLTDKGYEVFKTWDNYLTDSNNLKNQMDAISSKYGYTTDELVNNKDKNVGYDFIEGMTQEDYDNWTQAAAQWAVYNGYDSSYVHSGLFTSSGTSAIQEAYGNAINALGSGNTGIYNEYLDSTTFFDEDQLEAYKNTTQSAIDDTENKITQASEAMDDYGRAIVRLYGDVDDLSDAEQEIIDSAISGIDLTNIDSAEAYQAEILQIVADMKEFFANNPEIIDIITEVDEAETANAASNARQKLKDALIEQYGADGYDDQEKRILLKLGFEVEEIDGEQILKDTKDIMQNLADLGINETNGNNISLNNLGELKPEDAEQVYKWYKNGDINANTTMDTLVDMLHADRVAPSNLTGKMRYTEERAGKWAELSDRMQSNGFTVTKDEEGNYNFAQGQEQFLEDIKNLDVNSAFGDYNESVRKQIQQLKEDALDPKKGLTAEDVQERMESILGAELVAIEGYEAEVAEALLETVFPEDIGIDGYIDTFSELKTALDAVGESYEALSEAQKEMQNNNKLSLSTMLDLLAANENYAMALEFEKDQTTGEITAVKLATNAKEIMAMAQIEATKASLALTIQQKDEEIQAIETSIAEVDAAIASLTADDATNGEMVEGSVQVVEAMTARAKAVLNFNATIAGLGAAVKAFLSGDFGNIKSAYQEAYNETKQEDEEYSWRETYKGYNKQELEDTKADLEKKLADKTKLRDAFQATLDGLETVTLDNVGSWLDDEGFIDSVDSATEAIDKLKDAIDALNLEYEQMIAYNEKGMHGLTETANALKESYYNVKEELIDKAIAIAESKLGGKSLSDILLLTGDEYDEAMENYQTLQDLYVQKKNLDDEEIQNRLDMLTVMGDITDEQIELLKAKIETADTEQEELEYIKEYNDAVREQIKLKKEVAEYEKKLADYQLEYLEGQATLADGSANTAYEAAIDKAEDALEAAVAQSKKLVETTYQQLYDYYMSLGIYTSSEADALAKESSEYREAVLDYLDAQQALGDLYMTDFENKVSTLERRMKELETSKPNKWATDWDSTTNTVSGKTALQKMRDYYGTALSGIDENYIKSLTTTQLNSLKGLNGYYVKIAKEAYDTLTKYSDSLTDEQIVTLTEKYNDAMKSIRDTSATLLEETKSYQESVYSAITEEVEEYKSQLEKQKEIISDYYDAEIEKLNDKNEAIERTNKLLELQQNLLNAQQEKERVYRAGIGWVYESDRTKVKAAENDLKDFYLQDSIDDLNNAKDAELEALEERIQNWDDYLEMLETKYEEYERLQNKKLLMEQLDLQSTQDVEAAIKADMLDFTSYMSTHIEDFLKDQINAFTEYGTLFDEFLSEYKKTQEELDKINTEEVNVISADDYLGKNDTYLDIPDATPTVVKKNNDQSLYEVVLNDKSLKGTVKDVDSQHYDSNGFVDYNYSIQKNVAAGDYYQAGYELALRQAKIEGAVAEGYTEYEKYAFDVDEYISDLNNDLADDSKMTEAQITAFKNAYLNAQAMTNAINTQNKDLTSDILQIESDNAQVALAFATSFPAQLSESQAAQLQQMVENNITNANGYDSLGLSVSDSLGTTATDINDNMEKNKDAIVEELSKIYEELYTEAEAEAVYESYTGHSYSSSGGGGGSVYSALGESTYESAKSSYSGSSGGSSSGSTKSDSISASRVQEVYDLINTGKAGTGVQNRIDKLGDLGYSEAEVRAGQSAINAAYSGTDIATAVQNATDKANGYANGIEEGPVTYTGLAMLHGTPESPEYVLNSDQAYNLLRYMSLKQPEFESNMTNDTGDNWTLNGDIVLENCDDPAQFWSEVTKAMSNRFNVTKNRK